MANEYLRDGRIETEKKDCSVIALSYAFNIDYSHAHKICKDNGRKDNNGFSLRKVFDIKEKDFRSFVFKLGDSRIVTYYGRPKMTVGKFRDTHKEGIYILRVGGHIFTIIDGIIFNNKNDRCIISEYYHITKSKQ